MKNNMESNIESGKSKKELSAEEKRIAMSLEFFPHLNTKDKIFLVLIWRGFKQASPISLQGGVPESVELEKRLKKANLFFKKDRIIREEIYGLQPGQVYFVANNEKDLDLISKLWFGDHEHDPIVYKGIGKMSGYPQSAIDVFDSFANPDISDAKRGEVIINNVLLNKQENVPLDLYPFARSFYMSKQNWKNELETVRKWVEEIKSITPALYNSYLEEFKRRQTNNL